MSESSKIIKRILFGIKVKLASPLCVSNGLDELTDNDLQRDFDGEVFIPGTSLAGAMRAYIKNDDNLFGFNSEQDGRMSPLIVSDMTFEEEKKLVTGERDGVGLEHKVSKPGAKFNIEVIETGAVGMFHLCLTIRKKDIEVREASWIKSLKRIFNGIQTGEIRFGAKKNRGFGCFNICHIFIKNFTINNVDEWISYGHDDNKLFLEKNKVNSSDWLDGTKRKYMKMRVPLELTGGISIRKYAIQEDYDFEQLKSDGKAVIPGTSWTGAIRERMIEILRSLSPEKDATEFIEDWFGFVVNDKKERKRREKKGEQIAAQSHIVVCESQMDKRGEELKITRNKVNRFDCSTVDGALYTDLGYFQGNTFLDILIEKDRDEFSTNAFIGLLLLVIKDLMKGYLAVGGQTAVGRGIFKGELNKVELEDSTGKRKISDSMCKIYWNALKKYLTGGNVECLIK